MCIQETGGSSGTGEIVDGPGEAQGGQRALYEMRRYHARDGSPAHQGQYHFSITNEQPAEELVLVFRPDLSFTGLEG